MWLIRWSAAEFGTVDEEKAPLYWSGKYEHFCVRDDATCYETEDAAAADLFWVMAIYSELSLDVVEIK